LLSFLTWNFVNSSALSSSLASIRRTTCCGSNVKEPRFRTSLPCSSTNSRTCNTHIMRHAHNNFSHWKHVWDINRTMKEAWFWTGSTEISYCRHLSQSPYFSALSGWQLRVIDCTCLVTFPKFRTKIPLSNVR
jgi:hypothetical protein